MQKLKYNLFSELFVIGGWQSRDFDYARISNEAGSEDRIQKEYSGDLDLSQSDPITHKWILGFFLPLVGFACCGGHQNQELTRHPDLQC